MGDDTRFLQISTPIQQGNSGGPLLDMHGNVVGVVVAQLNALSMMQAGGGVPQNVNFAIQTPIVVNFLTTKGVSPNMASSVSTPDLSPADVADAAKKFTVQVYCKGISTKVSSNANLPALTAYAVAEKFGRGAALLAVGKVGQASTSLKALDKNAIRNWRSINLP
jgi:hypothetical protein